MHRLDFRLPEFAPRISWANPEARRVWQPRIQRLSTLWFEVERAATAQGLRPSCLQIVQPEHLAEFMKDIATRGLIALPLNQVPNANGYSSVGRDVQAGEPWAYKVAVTHPELAADWAKSPTDHQIGVLLGYPECCCHFFDRVWNEEKWMDTTWPMTLNNVTINDTVVTRSAPVNILWRWHGVRLVSHLPCNFSCEASLKQGLINLGLLKDIDPEAAEWMIQILSWPVEWSALHGIAEILTPIHRTCVATDATAEKLTVKLEGSMYPAEGATGTQFPYQPPPKLLPFIKQRPEDNGFSSRMAQAEAHKVVLQAVPKRKIHAITDLGCGDGLLASQIDADRRIGVEVDPARAAKARARLDEVLNVPLNTLNALPPDLLILMPGRLLEPGNESLLPLLSGREIIVYAYGHWLEETTLPELVHRAGLTATWLTEVFSGPEVSSGRILVEQA